MKPKTPSGVPWALFWLLTACGLAVLCAQLMQDPGLVSTSGAQLTSHGTFFTVECDATNRAAYRLSREVQFTIYASGNSSGSMRALDQRGISLFLGPGEKRHVTCDFPNKYRFLPDRAGVEVLLTASTTPEPVAIKSPESFFTRYPAAGIILGICCLAVSTLLIVHLWYFQQRDSFTKKVCWTFVLLIPLAGWLAYGGLYHPPGYNETPGWISSWYAD